MMKKGEPMSDLIRREDVMRLAESGKLLSGSYGERAKDIIKAIPTAEPKAGKWFDHSDEGYVQCPFCGSLTTCEDNMDELHYCFNCGAKMERSE